jgi:hypothetical protein
MNLLVWLGHPLIMQHITGHVRHLTYGGSEKLYLGIFDSAKLFMHLHCAKYFKEKAA